MKVRVRHTQIYPPAIVDLLYYYQKNSQANFQIVVPETPKSVNHQYLRGGKGGRSGSRLHPDIQAFRELVSYSGIKRWRPIGLVAVVMVFQHPLWITKEHKVRLMDLDNKIKATLDAIGHCTGWEDSTVWAAHAFKLCAKKEKTVLHFFDLGDVVDLI